MQYRIPRAEIDDRGIPKSFPNKCIVCGEKAEKGLYTEIHYHPPVKMGKELNNFILRLPLCKKHYDTYKKGKKQARIAMFLLLGAMIPFVLAIIFSQIFESQTPSMVLFIIAIIIAGGGFFLFNPSNEALKESREAVAIVIITGHEVILEIKNKKLEKILSK